jgi:poly(3-hydroxybutyrate) depolymerase
MRDNYCIDNRRIYASGYGIGGGFVDTLACSPHHGEDFAAFAMVAPALFTEADGSWCKPERPLPILESKLPSIRLQKHVANLVTVHGADDDVNCYNGGKTEGVPYLSVPDFLKRWAKRDSCNKIPDSCTKHDGLVHTTSYTCQGMENFVEGVHLVGQKHGWPSTQTNMRNNGVKAPIDASKTIIEFFKKHYNRHA